MKRLVLKIAAIALLAAFAIPSVAQDTKEKEKEKKNDVEQIVITKKGDNNEKIVIEIIGDKVTVNGKPSDELKGDDIKVHRNKYKSLEGLSNYNLYQGLGSNYNFRFNDGNDFGIFSSDNENRAMLGVVTEKVDKGAKVNEVTEKSAAEKAGIKKGDIITKVGDTKIEDSDDLSETIRKNKPGEKVNITLLRDNIEQTLSAELGKWSGFGGLTVAPKIPNMEVLRDAMPRVQAVPRGQYNYLWSGNSPKLGLSVQDTDDGKGVKVIDVDSDSNAAKAGIKENDIITHFNDKEVNGADEVAKMVKENKDKISIQLKVKRDGKVQNIEVKMPRKLKTADL